MSTRVDTDAKVDKAQMIVAWVITVMTLGYMLPWAVAASRGKSNALPVALVNFFVGWTLIGWVVALVMACGAHQVVGRTDLAVAPPRPQTWVDGTTGHTLAMNPITGQPMRIDPATGQPWVEPSV